ncbi:hypothetical protein BC938DRAFT_477225, partial [Jimgerdemannia flammicorona]
HFELIGDAALNLSSTLWLRKTYPHEDVGRLTHRRQCMVGNRLGLKDLATHFELARFAFGPGKKLLPNVVESLIGVMQTLHGFDFVDAFLSPLFDDHAKTWFNLYLPDGVKEDIAKAEIRSGPDTGSSNVSSDLPFDLSNNSYRNEISEYLLRRSLLYPGRTNSELRISFRQAGEANHIQWIAYAVVDVDGYERHKSAQRLSKKVAQNEACYLLLKYLKEYDSQPPRATSFFPVHADTSYSHNGYQPSTDTSSPPPHSPSYHNHNSQQQADTSSSHPSSHNDYQQQADTSSSHPSSYNDFQQQADPSPQYTPLYYGSQSRSNTSSPSPSSHDDYQSRAGTSSPSLSSYNGFQSRSDSPSPPYSSSHNGSLPPTPSSPNTSFYNEPRTNTSSSRSGPIAENPRSPPSESEPIIELASFQRMLPTSNYKGVLLTQCQRGKDTAGITLPEYSTEQQGSSHNMSHFKSVCKVGGFVSNGVGQKKADAEQNAAKCMLEQLCGKRLDALS